MSVTFDTIHLLISALNEEAAPKAVVFFGRRKRSVRCECVIDRRNKKSTEGSVNVTCMRAYSYAKKDLLLLMSVTLATTHLLISALNEEAPAKADVF